MKKRIFVFLLISCLMAFLIGCRKEKSSNVPDSDSGLSGKITIWTGSWNDPLLPNLIKGFTDKNPDVKVTCEYLSWDGMEDKYLSALQANAGPDILDMAIAWTIPFASMGKLQNLDKYIANAGLNMNDFYESARKTLTINGSVYALPYRSETMAMFYNKRLFRESGLDPETPPKTWNDLLEYSRKLTKGDVYGFGLCGSNAGNATAQIYSIMFSNGVLLLTDDFKKAAFNTPKGLEAFSFWCDLAVKEKVVPRSALENDNTVNRNLFAEEKIAMFISGSYDMDPILEANPNIDMGFCLIPAYTPGNHTAQLGGWNLGMSSSCKEPEAAFALMEYLCSPEISIQYSNTFSSTIEANKNPKYADPQLQVFIEAINYGVPLPGSPMMNQITSIIYNEAQAVLSGIKDAETALSDAEKEVNAIL
jgi:multiple sugar transport system substrate-binding protein